jgi:isopentenyldiphosphate isomerase
VTIGFGNDHVKHKGEGFLYHHAHAVMVIIFEVKGGALKDFKMKTKRTSPDRWTKRIIKSSRFLAQLQQKTIGYILIFRSSMKSSFQRIKRQGDRRFLQADMAESPIVPHAEILDRKQC